jgi:hypothetical protein
LAVDTPVLKFGITDLSVVKEAKATKKGTGHLTQRVEIADAREPSVADGAGAPVTAKNDKKYPRMILWAFLSIVFLAAGSVACGLLSQEEDTTKAVLLFLAALAETAGCIFFFYCFLQEISPKPKPPFISTLH